MRIKCSLFTEALLAVVGHVAAGGLEFQISRWFWLQVGWRYLKYDYNQGGFTNKTALNAPFIHVGVNF
jgi:hypothetical protein